MVRMRAFIFQKVLALFPVCWCFYKGLVIVRFLCRNENLSVNLEEVMVMEAIWDSLHVIVSLLFFYDSLTIPISLLPLFLFIILICLRQRLQNVTFSLDI